MNKEVERIIALTREIYAEERCEEVVAMVQKHPLRVTILLLEKIKEDLPDVSSMLAFTVDEATYSLLDDDEETETQPTHAGKKERVKKK